MTKKFLLAYFFDLGFTNVYLQSIQESSMPIKQGYQQYQQWKPQEIPSSQIFPCFEDCQYGPKVEICFIHNSLFDVGKYL